jgi:hypothetical protein
VVALTTVVDTRFADALIATFVKLREAQYVITDDPNFEELGVKAIKWTIP